VSRAAVPTGRAAGSGERAPAGLTIGAGALVMVVAGLVAAAVPADRPDARFGVIVVAVGGFAAVSLDRRAIGPVALIGLLIADGFLEDRFGELSWHGLADVWRVLLLALAGVVGLAAGAAVRGVRVLRYRVAADVRPDGGVLADHVMDKEEEHGA